jgi:hypothetical protein
MRFDRVANTKSEVTDDVKQAIYTSCCQVAKGTSSWSQSLLPSEEETRIIYLYFFCRMAFPTNPYVCCVDTTINNSNV